MVEKIAENLYRIGVPLPNNPLKELNSYLIRGERDLLIDTGFRKPECREALLQGLAELGSRRENRDVYVTHYHADHFGLAAEMAAENGKIYMSRPDYTFFWDMSLTEKGRTRRRQLLLEDGFPPELMEAFYHKDSSVKENVERRDERFIPLEDGTHLHYGGYDLQLVVVPGHTPGQAMLWNAENGIMFTGDHVLFDISPNITAWHGIEDSLGNYLDSLRKVRDYPVRIALPGHRHSGNYGERIDALLAHHQRRVEEALRLVRDHPGLTAYELTALMRWKIRAKNWVDFPLSQKFFATGECVAHLDYLRARGHITRERRDGVWHYTAVG